MKFAKAERVLSATGLPSARTLLAMSGVVAAMLFAPIAAQAGPGPDVNIQKSCALDPSKGPTAVVCVINVANIGTVASISPITITDTPTGPPGTTFLTQPGSTFPCAPSSGAMPPSFTCTAPFALNPGGPMAGGSSGSTFLTFTLPPQGGTLTNCAKVTSGQNPTTPGDQNLSNNGPSCSTVTLKGSGGGGTPDVKVEKSCALDPAKGPTVVVCVINVANIGTVASISPITITDTPTGPSGTTFITQPGSTFPCTPTSGALPPSFTCSAPLSLSPGGPMAGGSSGSTFLTFTLPPQGGTLSNCAKVTSGSGDQNLSNNGPSCSRVTVKGTGGGDDAPDLSTFKECKKGANNSMTCWIKVTNNGPGPSPTPLYLTDTISPIPAGTLYTGASGNVSCGGAGPLVAPISCTINQPIPAGSSVTVVLSFTFKGKGDFLQCAKIAQKSAKPEKDPKNNEYCLKMSMP